MDLVGADYNDFVEGRKSTQTTLDAVLAAARRYCGWHVSPVQSQVVSLNGTGQRRLFLATKRLVSLTSVVENGVDLTVGADAVADPETPGLLWRLGGCWSPGIGNVQVRFEHGYTEAEAADWRRAVLKMTQLWLQAPSRSSSDLKRKKVDDVEYEWFESVASTNVELAASFAQFRLIPAP